MTKPVITTRAGKGSALTWTEGDTNLTNLRDATITLTAGSGGTDVVSDLNGAVTLVAGTNISLAGDNTAKTITITNTASAGASDLNALTDVNFNNGVGGALAANNVLLYTGTEWTNYPSSSLSVSSATTSTTATNATNVAVTTDATNATRYLTFVSGSVNGNYGAMIDTGLTWNPSTNLLSIGSGSFSGALNGTVGATTPSTGAFTTLSASSGVTFNGSFATISLQPTGTGGTVTIAPGTTTGTINNMSIGATTASTGAFTTLSASSTVSGTGFTNRFASPGPIGSTTASTGAFTTLSSSGLTTANSLSVTTNATLKDIRETVFALTYAATITPDVANGSIQTITLTGGVTFSAFANPVAGQSMTLIVTQDATGGRTLTSTMKFSGGSKTLSTAANAIDIISVFYDGTNYYASLGKGFA